MAVIVQYVVIRDEVEKMTFTTKKEADAYDKMLDIAESLYGFLENSSVEIDGDKLDELSFYIAQHSDEFASILKGGSSKKSSSGKSAKTKAEGSSSEKSDDKAADSTPADDDSTVTNINNKDAA